MLKFCKPRMNRKLRFHSFSKRVINDFTNQVKDEAMKSYSNITFLTPLTGMVTLAVVQKANDQELLVFRLRP